MAVQDDKTKELQELGKEVWELTGFETAYVPKQTPPILWSPEKYRAAHLLALSGKNRKETAKEMGIPVGIIVKWDQSPEFQDYKRSLVEEYVQCLKNDNIATMLKIIAARKEQAEMEGYADLSKKDTVDIMAEIRKATGDEKTSDNSYMRLLEKLVTHSMTSVPQTTIVLEQKPSNQVQEEK